MVTRLFDPVYNVPSADRVWDTKCCLHNHQAQRQPNTIHVCFPHAESAHKFRQHVTCMGRMGYYKKEGLACAWMYPTPSGMHKNGSTIYIPYLQLKSHYSSQTVEVR